MQTPAGFSAKEWVRINIVSAEDLEPDTLAAVEGFVLMWNLFEGLVCDNSATMSRLEKLAVEIVERRRCKPELERILAWFKKLYCPGSRFTAAFQELRLRPTDRQELVEAVLQAKTKEYQPRVLALLIIIYRLYSNLFRNLKTLDQLNGRAPGLIMASRGLATVIEAHGRHFKRERYPK
jgi:hypothetical protein